MAKTQKLILLPEKYDELTKINLKDISSENIKLYAIEINDDVIDFIKNNDLPNLTYKIPAILNFNLTYANVTFSEYWFDKKIYKKFKKFFNNETESFESKEKKYYFDALLGTMHKRKNRLFFQNFVLKNKLEEKIYLKFFKNESDSDFIEKEINDEFDFGLNIDKNLLIGKKNTWDRIMYENMDISISNLVPVSIYENTAFSIIAETRYTNDYTMFTEKTVKPLLAKRLFIAFCGKNYLKNLKSLGFLTFSDVIDETYDEIENDIERWKKASEQVMFLTTQSQVEIFKKIETIVEHNHEHLLKNFKYNPLDY